MNESGAIVPMGAIVQLQTFDMDADGKDDIVTLDDNGDLSILYASTDTNSNIVFTKKVVDSSLGLKLNRSPSSDNGAVYFAGLPQLDDSQNSYVAQSQALASNSGSDAELKNELNSEIYYQFGEASAVSDLTGSASTNDTPASLTSAEFGTDENGNPNTALQNQIGSLTNNLSSYAASGSVDTSSIQKGNVPVTRTFLRSTFAKGKGITVAKTYADTNGDQLKE